MSKAIIEDLEMIDIDHEQRKWLPITVSGLCGILERVIEFATSGQTGHYIQVRFGRRSRQSLLNGFNFTF